MLCKLFRGLSALVKWWLVKRGKRQRSTAKAFEKHVKIHEDTPLGPNSLARAIEFAVHRSIQHNSGQ